MTNEYRIAVIAGDGIGQEVMPEGLKVLRTAEQTLGNFRLHFEEFPWGTEYYLKHGRMLPFDGLKILEGFDAIYLGAVGLPALRRIMLRYGGCCLRSVRALSKALTFVQFISSLA
jgi:tartrate dehydrogenase/decarboxylase/D-malate dehydrogenase